MGRASCHAMALVAALALGACADGANDLTTAPNPPAFQLAEHGGIVLVCSPTDLRRFAQNLFGSRHPALDQAKLITSKNANSPAANAAGYNVMDAVADLRSAAAAWSAAQRDNAANLTVQLIGCMDVDISDKTLTTPALLLTAFKDALEIDGTGGYWVRGGALDGEDPALAQNGIAGLQSPGAFGTWLGGRSLLFGREITSFSDEVRGGVSYDWSAVRPIPAGGLQPLNGLGTVALCALSSSSAADAASYRVQHKGGAAAFILQVTSSFLDCTDVVVAFAGPLTLPERLAQALFERIQPKPVFAATSLGGSGPGGLLGSLSPFELVDPVEVHLAFVFQPADVGVNSPVLGTDGTTLGVRVTGNVGTPWKHVEVKLQALANNGATLDIACGASAVTGEDGIARFPLLSINKPGGMFFVASTISGTDDPDIATYFGSVESDRFSVHPGSATPPCT